MKWGSAEFGSESFWGTSPYPEIAAYAALASEDRVLIQMGEGTGERNLRDFVGTLVENNGAFKAVADQIKNAFDLETAFGLQLDFLGAVVGLPRQGFNDIRYRVFLDIQVDLLLAGTRDDANWTGTHNNILSICRKFVGPSAGPIVLTNKPPYAFTLTVPSITPAEILVLSKFISDALYAGVRGVATFPLVSTSIWDSVNVPISGADVWGSVNVAVTDAATWGISISVGDD